MAKQTINRDISTNIGGSALKHIQEKGLKPLTGAEKVAQGDVEGIQISAPSQIIDPFIEIEDNYAKYLGRAPRILRQGEEDLLREMRAQRQTTLDVVGKGIAKTAGKLAIHTIGGLSNIVSFAGAALYTAGKTLNFGYIDGGLKELGEDFNSFYDNAYYKALDKGVEGLDKLMPIYQTKAQQDSSFWSWKNLTSAKFVVDDFLGGMTFLGGNLLSGVGVGIVAKSFGFTAKLMKNLKKVNKALDPEDLAKLLATTKNQDAGLALFGQTLVSGYEAGLQARQFRESSMEEYRKNFIEENMRTPTDQELSKFAKEITQASNGVFAINFGMVTAENLVMFNKIFGKPLKKLLPKAAKTGKVPEIKPSRFNHVVRGIYRTVYKPVFEGSQEFAQELVNRAATEFVLAKYSLDGHNANAGFFDYYGSALNEMYNDEDAWKEAYIGVLMGLVGIPGVATGSIKDAFQTFKTPTATAQSIAYHKFDTGNVMKNVVANMARIYEVTRNKEQAIANGNLLDSKTEEAKEFISWMSSRFNVGLLDEEIETYLNTLDKMTDDEFKEQFDSKGMSSKDISERKEYLKESLMKKKENFVRAKELTDSIIDPGITSTLENSEEIDLNEHIVFQLYMNNDIVQRVESINQSIKAKTGLSVEEIDPATGKTLLEFFDDKGNITKDAPDALKKYMKDPNNYFELITDLTERGDLTKLRDIYAENIKKLYNVEYQAKLVDKMNEMKFMIFEKFAKNVDIYEKNLSFIDELKEVKNKLEFEKNNETDKNKIDEIDKDIEKIQKRINALTKKVNRQFPSRLNVIALKNVIEKLFLDPQRKKYEPKMRKPKVSIDLSKIELPEGFETNYGKNIADRVVYRAGESFYGLEVKENEIITIIEKDENNLPKFIEHTSFDKKTNTILKRYQKINFSKEGKASLSRLKYDDFISIAIAVNPNIKEDLLNHDRNIKRGDFVGMEYIAIPIGGMGKLLFGITILNADGKKTLVNVESQNVRTSGGIAFLSIAIRNMIRANNSIREDVRLLFDRRKIVPESIISIADQGKYIYEIIENSNGEYVNFSSASRPIIRIRATLQNSYKGTPGLKEDVTFISPIYSSNQVFKGKNADYYNNLMEKINKDYNDKIEALNEEELLLKKQSPTYSYVGRSILVVDENGGVDFNDNFEIVNKNRYNKAKESKKNIYISEVVSDAVYDDEGNMVSKPVVRVEVSKKSQKDYVAQKDKEFQDKVELIDRRRDIVDTIRTTDSNNLINEYIKDLENDEENIFDPDYSSFDGFYDDRVEFSDEEIKNEINDLTGKQRDREIARFGLAQKNEIKAKIVELISSIDSLKEFVTPESQQMISENIMSIARLLGNMQYNYDLGVTMLDEDKEFIDATEEMLIELINELSDAGSASLNYDATTMTRSVEVDITEFDSRIVDVFQNYIDSVDDDTYVKIFEEANIEDESDYDNLSFNARKGLFLIASKYGTDKDSIDKFFETNVGKGYDLLEAIYNNSEKTFKEGLKIALEYFNENEKANEGTAISSEKEVSFNGNELLPLNVIEELINEYNKDKSKKSYSVVKRVLFPAVLDSEGNTIYRPIVEYITFTAEQASDIAENKEEYTKTYIDLINERYKYLDSKKDEEEEEGDDGDDGDGGSTYEDLEYGPLAKNPRFYGVTSGEHTTNGLEYALDPSARIDLQHPDFLRKASLFTSTPSSDFVKTLKDIVKDIYSKNSKDIPWVRAFGSSENMIREVEAAVQEVINNPGKHKIGFINVDTKNLYFKKDRSGTYFQFERSAYVDEHTKMSLMMVIEKNGKVIPIGEVKYYDAYIDENGEPLGPNPYPGIIYREDDKKRYKNSYYAIKSLWERSSYNEILYDDSISSKFNFLNINTYNKNHQQSIGDIVEHDSVRAAYFQSGRNIYVYNRETGQFEEYEGDTSLRSKLNQIKRNMGLTNSSMLFVDTGENKSKPVLHPIVVDMGLRNTNSIENFNKKIDEIFNAANQAYADSPFENIIQTVERVAKEKEISEVTPFEGSDNSLRLTPKDFVLRVFSPLKSGKNFTIQSRSNDFYIEQKISENVVIRIRKNKDNEYEISYKLNKEDGFDTVNLGEGNFIDTYRLFLFELQEANTEIFNRENIVINRSGFNFSPNDLSKINGIKTSTSINPNIEISQGEVKASARTEFKKRPTEKREVLTEDEKKSVYDFFGDFKDEDGYSFSYFMEIKSNNQYKFFKDRNIPWQTASVIKYRDKIYIEGTEKRGKAFVKVFFDLNSIMNGNPKSYQLSEVKMDEASYVVGFVPVGSSRNTYHFKDSTDDIISLRTGNIVFPDRENKERKKIERDIYNSFLNYYIEYSDYVDNEESASETRTAPTEEAGIAPTGTEAAETEAIETGDGFIINTNDDELNDDDDVPFSTDNTDAVQQDISKAKKELAKIVPFQVEEMSDALQNMLNDGTAVGAFHRNIIYLLDNSQQYHEAFHGVFRTLMSEKEVNTILNLAKKKYAKPSQQEIARLRNLTERNKTLTTSQIIDLYYEEKLAEDFQQFMNEGKSIFQRFWRKIKDFIRSFMRNEESIYSIFRGIENGNYAKAQIRKTAPYAFSRPAFATILNVRMNEYGKIHNHHASKTQIKDVAGMVARQIMRSIENISDVTNADILNAMKDVRQEFNPRDWIEYLMNNNFQGVLSKMQIVLDYYNSLSTPGDLFYVIRFNKESNQYEIQLVKKTPKSRISKNAKEIISEVRRLTSLYSGEAYYDLEENEDLELEEFNNEPDEMVKKDSNKYGGFKSESKAFRLFMAVTTYDKELFFSKENQEKREITMPIKAEKVYNKINRLLSGTNREDFMNVLRYASKDDIELRAFFNRIEGEIEKEISMGAESNYLQNEIGANPYYNSPTWNLLVKTFYKTNHDYLHVKTGFSEGGKSIVSYFPNRFNYSDFVYNNWKASYNRLNTNSKSTLESLELLRDKLLDINYYPEEDDNLEQMIDDVVKILRDRLGITVGKGYIRYNYSKENTSSVNSLEALGIDILSPNVVDDLISNMKESRNKSFLTADNISIIKKIALGSTYFENDHRSFVLRDAKGDMIYTSLYNSYDTELFDAIKRSVENGVVNVDTLRKNLEEFGYTDDIIDRYVSMAKRNYMFNQPGLTPSDFDIIYSFGMDSTTYADLEQYDRDKFKVKAYLSNPGQINPNSRRLFNPFVIAEKNTNKIIKFQTLNNSVRLNNNTGLLEIDNKIIDIFYNYYLIEQDSVDQYESDIRKLISGEKLNTIVHGYHYNEYFIDGVETKVVSIDNKYYAITEIFDTKTYKTHNIFTGYNVKEIEKPENYKEPRGSQLFEFKSIADNMSIHKVKPEDKSVMYMKAEIRSWLENKLQKEIDTRYIAGIHQSIISEIANNNDEVKPINYYTNNALNFLVNDYIASMGFQYALYGGSHTFNHKDYIDTVKRNSGVNANGPGIGNSHTKVAIVKSVKEILKDPIIVSNNNDTEVDTQDGQNYATSLWYFSKYAKYKSVVGIRDIALKVVAGISLNEDEISTLEKNNMLLTDRKIVIRNTYLYDKTSAHIQAREAVSILKVSEDIALQRWEEYLSNPSPELYNEKIYPMYDARPGFEYHHDMLNSMEAQDVGLLLVDSAAKNSIVNLANNVKEIQPFLVDDRFIKEQVKTDNTKGKISSTTQAIALLYAEQSEEFKPYAEKFLAILAERVSIANNIQMAKYFPDGKINYQLIWDEIKANISINDPQLYDLLNVENGVPKYNWNLPNINNRVISSFMASMSNNGLKQKVKGTKANLVSAYGYGEDLNWKIELDQYPGVYFSEVYVTRQFLKKHKLEVGDIMWGTRIPTEDKYSMGNLYIKGVVEGPYNMSIFLPKQLMYLSGADYDLDSLYVKIMNTKIGSQMLKDIYDKDVTARELLDKYLVDKTEMSEVFGEEIELTAPLTPEQEIETINDILTFLSVLLTHNSGNQKIYSSGVSLDPIKNSKVKSNEVAIESSSFFFDRSTAEASNSLSKNGIGSSAVFNLVYQVLNKYYPEIYPTVNSEGIRMNKYSASHIAAMTDNPKNLLMSKYGLNGDNINKIMIFMVEFNLTYDEALLAVRDYDLITTNTNPAIYFNRKKDMMSSEEFNTMMQEYADDGYKITYDENGDVEYIYIERLSKTIMIDNEYVVVPMNPGEISRVISNTEKLFFVLGKIIRLNRKMPATAAEYYEVEKTLSFNGIKIDKKYHKPNSKNYNDILKLLDGKRYVTAPGRKIYIDTVNELVEITIKKSSTKTNTELIADLIERDNVLKQNLAAYIAYGEFSKNVFIKFKPLFRVLVQKLDNMIDEQIEDYNYNYNYGIDESQLISIKKNLDDFVMSALNAMNYVDENKAIYTGVLYESLDDGTGYMEALSKRILKDTFVKLLYDVKYDKTKSGNHIAIITTVNDESNESKLEYTNDYQNLLNASDRYSVIDDFIAAEDKQYFIDNLSISDAKLLMSLFIFNYAMSKDAMMYNSTSFSKIIDPRLFSKYANASQKIFNAFTSVKSYTKHYGTNNFEGHMNSLAGKIFGSLLNYSVGEPGKKIFPIVKNYSKEAIKPKMAKFIYASPGLGKTTLSKKDSKYIDLDELLNVEVKGVLSRETYEKVKATESSITVFNSIIIGDTDYSIKKRDEYGITNEDVSKIYYNLRKKINANPNSIVLSTLNEFKIQRIKGDNTNYDEYYLPNIDMNDIISDEYGESGSSLEMTIKRIGKREENAFIISEDNYLLMYVNPYKSRKGVKFVRNNLEESLKINDFNDLLKENNNEQFEVIQNDKKYIIVGEFDDMKIFDENYNEVFEYDNATRTKFMYIQRVRAGKAVIIDGKYIVTDNNSVYSLEDKGFVFGKNKNDLIEKAGPIIRKTMLSSDKYEKVEVSYTPIKGKKENTYTIVNNRIFINGKEVYQVGPNRNIILALADVKNGSAVLVDQYIIYRKGRIVSVVDGLINPEVENINEIKKRAIEKFENIAEEEKRTTETEGEKGKELFFSDLMTAEDYYNRNIDFIRSKMDKLISEGHIDKNTAETIFKNATEFEKFLNEGNNEVEEMHNYLQNCVI